MRVWIVIKSQHIDAILQHFFKYANGCRNWLDGFFLEFRDGLSELYYQVFGGGDDIPESTEFSRNWNWYSTIDELACSDITKYEEITKLNLHTCLNNLCYKIDKRKKDAEELKKIKSNGQS